MNRHLIVFALPPLLLACGRPAPAARAQNPKSASAGEASREEVSMHDDCDPASFNAAIGAGTCVRDEAGLPFRDFIAELRATRVAEDWTFDEARVEAKPGSSLLVVNEGGENHTFTRVSEFGGGIVPNLNALSGNPVVADGCKHLTGGDFQAPGSEAVVQVGTTGRVVRYQCCIHPWMRTEVVLEER